MRWERVLLHMLHTPAYCLYFQFCWIAYLFTFIHSHACLDWHVIKRISERNQICLKSATSQRFERGRDGSKTCTRLWGDGALGGQTGRWVKGWGARTKHRNPMTRETVCDSQGLILLIALSHLIMARLQAIFSLKLFFLQKQNKKATERTICLAQNSRMLVSVSRKQHKSKKEKKKGRRTVRQNRCFDCQDKERSFFTMTPH